MRRVQYVGNLVPGRRWGVGPDSNGGILCGYVICEICACFRCESMGSKIRNILKTGVTIMSVDIKMNVSACDKWSSCNVDNSSMFVLRLLRTSNGDICRCPSFASKGSLGSVSIMLWWKRYGRHYHTCQDHWSRTLLPSVLERKFVRFCFS